MFQPLTKSVHHVRPFWQRKPAECAEDTLAGERQFSPPKWQWAWAAGTFVADEDASDVIGADCEALRLGACSRSRCLIRGCACDFDGSGRRGLGALAGRGGADAEFPGPVPHVRTISLYISKCAALE